MHNLIYMDEDETDVNFLCSICNQPISFNKPGIGSPCPGSAAGVWIPPENPEQWMGPCLG